MFKFKGSKPEQSSTELAKSVEDFFTFSKIATLGFPYKPTTLAWDSCLCLMAIGTQHGNIRIYGAPGVQFCGNLRQKLSIVELLFIPRKAHLICLCSDNSLHLWELKEQNGLWKLEEVKSFVLTGLMKKITCIALNSSSSILYIGTMCGNIYTLNVGTFEMAESVIYQDVVVQNIPDDKKLKQGAVKTISYHSSNPDCLLIGYQQGLIILWDTKKLVVISTFIISQSLESVAWHHNGDQFISSYSDGSYVIWDIQDPSKPSEVPLTPYVSVTENISDAPALTSGPFACKAIHKILWNTVKGGDDYIIFSGGMPRSSYGEKFTVTIMCGDRHQVLDLSSKVINFFTISDAFDESEFDNPHSLIILVEEELIAIDLESEFWSPYKYPYLEIPHSSSITCYQFCPNVHDDLWRQLAASSQSIPTQNISENDWPIKGGSVMPDNNPVNNLLITGHENGSVKIWKATLTSLQLIYSFHTSQVFVTYDGEEEKEDDDNEEWPPFRKIGSFDVLSDDSRLAVKTLVLNDITRTLIVGGNGGQILVLQLLDTDAEKETIVTHITIGDKWDSSLWCNPQPLIVKHGKRKYGKGFHVQCVVQLTPPAPVTSLTFHAEWNLVAAGITHGFLLYDIVQKKSVMSRYTLNMPETSTVLANISPKSKSLKKSFRDSFRKLKITKSKSIKRERSGSLSGDFQELSKVSSAKRESVASSPEAPVAGSPSPELHSLEFDRESTDEVINSVRCLYFGRSFIINNIVTTPTLWVGTSNGSIYIYTITLPATGCRTSDAVTCQLGKEVQLKHQAPILGIQIVDHSGYPLPDPLDVQYQRSKPADLTGSHRVLVCTEEQIKVFTLPSMKPFCKNKITLTEGYHVSKVGFSTFPKRSDPKVCEYCAICLSDSNGITLYSIPELRRFISYNYCSLESLDIFSKTVFAQNGLLVCLVFPSEFEIISLSTSTTVKQVCQIEIPVNARDTASSLDNIVLMPNICLKNSKLELVDDASLAESIDPQVQNELNDIEDLTEQARCSPMVSRDRASFQLVETEAEVHENIAAEERDNAVSFNGDVPQQQVRKAPLAVIEELNSSEESHLNLINNVSRRNGHVS